MNNLPVCIICNTNNKTHLLYKNLISWDIGNRSNYYICKKCSLIFMHPLPEKSSLNKLYGSLKYWGIPKLNSKTLRYLENTEEVDYGYLYSILEKYKPGRVLDIGSGSGAFLNGMKKRGWSVTSNEISKQAKEFQKKAFNIENVTLNHKYSIKNRNNFNLVVLNNVLEHLTNPVEILKYIYTISSETGVLLLATPNTKSLGFKIFGNRWYHFDPRRHTYLFNLYNIGIILKNTGFSIDKIYYDYKVHNYAGIYESIRHIFKGTTNVSGNGIKSTKNVINMKNVYKLIATYFSLVVIKLEHYFDNGEVVVIVAKKLPEIYG